ncbi:ATP-binding protein [Streptomyces sp. NPDC020192]|uniref:ATP-binding protein n=1 Tax=Streptomyces sp. NPDC020192 TaxID=3365066 RepID=UPI0037A88895
MIQEAAIPNFSVLLSPTPRGARLARLLATGQLRDWDLPLESAEHIVAELAANAVTHGRVPGRDFRLTLYVVGDTLRIEVTDTRGDHLPRAQHTSPNDESGRGLLLVQALADRWGVTEGPTPRKTVWAEVKTGPESARHHPTAIALPGAHPRTSPQRPDRHAHGVVQPAPDHRAAHTKKGHRHEHGQFHP